jgi:hypothetical protein
MYRKILFICIIIYSVTSFAEIKVEISINKNEFLEAEPIFCSLKFINNSDFIDSIDYDLLGLYYLEILSPENKKMNYFGGINGKIVLKGEWIPLKKIEPRKEIVNSFNLLHYWGDILLNPRLNGAPGYLSSGSYTLRYNYDNRFYSSEINFKVNKPENDELNVFRKLIKAYQINDGKPWTMDSILLKKDTYYEIVINHPQSIYWEEAVYRYNEECNWLKLDYTDIYANKEFVRRFPYSFYIRHILINLCQAIYLYEGGEPAVNFYLQNLIENYKNYSVSEHAKEQLSKKEYLY